MKKTLTVVLIFLLQHASYGIEISSLRTNPPIKVFNKSQLGWGLNFGNVPTNKPQYGAGKNAFFVSLVLPGVGLYRANNKKGSLLYLPLCYYLVGEGLFSYTKNKVQGNLRYDEYLNSKNQTEIDQFYLDSQLHFSKARKKRNQLLIGTFIWAFQVYHTYRFGQFNDIYRKRNETIWTNILSVSSVHVDPFSNTVGFSTKITLK